LGDGRLGNHKMKRFKDVKLRGKKENKRTFTERHRETQSGTEKRLKDESKSQ